MYFLSGLTQSIYLIHFYFFNDQLKCWVAKTYANLSARFDNTKSDNTITSILLSRHRGDFYPKQYQMGQFA